MQFVNEKFTFLKIVKTLFTFNKYESNKINSLIISRLKQLLDLIFYAYFK
jgi:hypothetical protein